MSVSAVRHGGVVLQFDRPISTDDAERIRDLLASGVPLDEIAAREGAAIVPFNAGDPLSRLLNLLRFVDDDQDALSVGAQDLRDVCVELGRRRLQTSRDDERLRLVEQTAVRAEAALSSLARLGGIVGVAGTKQAVKQAADVDELRLQARSLGVDQDVVASYYRDRREILGHDEALRDARRAMLQLAEPPIVVDAAAADVVLNRIRELALDRIQPERIATSRRLFLHRDLRTDGNSEGADAMPMLWGVPVVLDPLLPAGIVELRGDGRVLAALKLDPPPPRPAKPWNVQRHEVPDPTPDVGLPETRGRSGWLGRLFSRRGRS